LQETYSMYGVNGKVTAELAAVYDPAAGVQPGMVLTPTATYQYVGIRKVGWNEGMEDRLGTKPAGSGRPYGENVSQYATHQKDATGLHYADQRYYASSWGRFLTADPSGANIDFGDPTSVNMYAYVNGDPANFNDPTGEGFWGSLAWPFKKIGQAIGGAFLGRNGPPPPQAVAATAALFAPPAPQRSTVTRLVEDLGVSQDCAGALDASLSGRTSSVSTGDARAALERARNARRTLEQAAAGQNGVDWIMLASIGLVETGFRAVAEGDGGPGRGVFQITVPGSATEEQANDLAWAASWTARNLALAFSRLSEGPNALGGDVLTAAALASHNTGVTGMANRIRALVARGVSADSLTTDDVVGTTTLRNGRRTGDLYNKMRDCFR
jgi:RHS repeat-associated protein